MRCDEPHEIIEPQANLRPQGTTADPWTDRSCGAGTAKLRWTGLERRKRMGRETVQTSSAPQAIGPYSQAIKVNGIVYTAGQIPIDPATGNFVAGGIREQTRQVLQNLQAVLQSAGSSLQSVVKATVFLKDMSDFTAMNEVYG